jgi:hypothetical protein
MCVGLGLAVVARVVEQLGGQLRVDSKLGQGSRFSFLIPFALADEGSDVYLSPGSSMRSRIRSRTNSAGSGSRSAGSSEIDSFVEALRGTSSAGSSTPAPSSIKTKSPPGRIELTPSARDGEFPVIDSKTPVRGVRIDNHNLDDRVTESRRGSAAPTPSEAPRRSSSAKKPSDRKDNKLRILIVEVSTLSYP